jgi:hypothetical protein
MIVRIYTGDDGHTHFEDLPLPAGESHNVALQAGANLSLPRTPPIQQPVFLTMPSSAMRGLRGL